MPPPPLRRRFLYRLALEAKTRELFHPLAFSTTHARVRTPQPRTRLAGLRSTACRRFMALWKKLIGRTCANSGTYRVPVRNQAPHPPHSTLLPERQPEQQKHRMNLDDVGRYNYQQ